MVKKLYFERYHVKDLLITLHIELIYGDYIEKDQLSIVAAGCALYYVDHNFNGRIQHITSLSLMHKEGIMGLDAFTIKNLEI